MTDCDCVPGHRCDCWDYRAADPATRFRNYGGSMVEDANGPWVRATPADSGDGGLAADWTSVWSDWLAYNAEATRKGSGFTGQQVIGARAFMDWYRARLAAGNPYREVTGYYDLDGRLLFEFDPAPPATPTSPDKAADGVGSPSTPPEGRPG